MEARYQQCTFDKVASHVESTAHKNVSFSDAFGQTEGRLRVIRIHLGGGGSMADEEAAAQAAAPLKDVEAPTIFDKILKKEIPSTPVYEDDLVYAFRDIAPAAPTHILIIPKNRDGLSQLSKAEERHKEILGQLLYSAKIVALQEGLSDGYRVVINDGPLGCQSVYHLHLHLIGGRQMTWPPG